MALQPQIVMGNGAFTVRRFMEVAAATTNISVRVAKTDDAPLPPPADFDPRFGTQVNRNFYEIVSQGILYVARATSETILNGAAIPAFFLLFFNKSGDFFLGELGLRAMPYRTLDPYYPSVAGPLTWEGLIYETVPVGEEPRYFDIILSRQPSLTDIQLTLDVVIPQTIIQ
jgi:hypothetical protein